MDFVIELVLSARVDKNKKTKEEKVSNDAWLSVIEFED